MWAAAVVACLAFFLYASLVEARRLELTFLQARLPGLGKELDGLRVLHLTDLHTIRLGRMEKEVLRLARRLSPDLVVITGDLCRRWGEKAGMRFLNALSAIGAREGVFFSPGNHDWKVAGMMASRAEGVRLLSNQWWLLQKGKSRLVLAGVNDPHTGGDNLEKALSGVPRDMPILLLAHSPDITQREGFDSGIQLCLCGHTHGGQICLPKGRALYVHTRHKVPASGLHRMKGVFVYISRGVGLSLLPFRIFCPPELTVVELQDAEGEDLDVRVVSRVSARRWLEKEAQAAH